MFTDKRRGDVWWLIDSHRKPTDTRLTRGDRPALVVSHDEATTKPTRPTARCW